MKSLSRQELAELQDALNYMSVAELKEWCHAFGISTTGKKGALVRRIGRFVSGRKGAEDAPLPPASCAKKGAIAKLAANALILSGSYKNNSATRVFMQTLVGPQFHFTAFGQDWIHERWRQGRPPTYQEFAAFWQEEIEKRKTRNATPKKEWAYLNFVQSYRTTHPGSSHGEVARAWGKERAARVRKAQQLLRRVFLHSS
jgi:hypothetical protein